MLLIWKMKMEKKVRIKMSYYTTDRETGTRIDWFATKEEAERAISYYEHCDTYEGIYEENFYAIEEVAEEEGM